MIFCNSVFDALLMRRPRVQMVWSCRDSEARSPHPLASSRFISGWQKLLHSRVAEVVAWSQGGTTWGNAGLLAQGLCAPQDNRCEPSGYNRHTFTIFAHQGQIKQVLNPKCIRVTCTRVQQPKDRRITVMVRPSYFLASPRTFIHSLLLALLTQRSWFVSKGWSN